MPRATESSRRFTTWSNSRAHLVADSVPESSPMTHAERNISILAEASVRSSIDYHSTGRAYLWLWVMKGSGTRISKRRRVSTRKISITDIRDRAPTSYNATSESSYPLIGTRPVSTEGRRWCRHSVRFSWIIDPGTSTAEVMAGDRRRPNGSGSRSRRPIYNRQGPLSRPGHSWDELALS